MMVLGLTLAACGKTEPVTIDAGRLGRVSLEPHSNGTAKEGKGSNWFDWLVAASTNAYSQPEAIPAGHTLGRDRALAELRALMRRDNGLLWIGHSTFVIRIGGITVLTDPVFSDYVSPLPPLGPKRYAPPPIMPEDLPALDLVLISHSHYDHLDVFSIREIARRFPKTRVLLPLGTESFGSDAGFENIRGVKPGDELKIGRIALTALPAYHVSSRSGFDAGMTPCLSWSLKERGGASVLFTGDTAYGPLFKRVREVYGPHRVAIVPIGAYEVREEVQHVHANPEEAIRIARDVGARVAVAMHWGTFPLSEEHPMEPAKRFKQAGGALAKVLRIGEGMGFGHVPARAAAAAAAAAAATIAE